MWHADLCSGRFDVLAADTCTPQGFDQLLVVNPVVIPTRPGAQLVRTPSAHQLPSGTQLVPLAVRPKSGVDEQGGGGVSRDAYHKLRALSRRHDPAH